MKKLQFEIAINAPVAHVYDTMLGISSKATYEQWTASFNPTSSYEGSWNQGEKILFVGVDEKGDKGGMVSRIEENIPNQFVSIKHIGLLISGKEVTEGPEVEKWTGMYENYAFKAQGSAATVLVEIEVSEDFADFMNETYPNALEKLKAICEG